MTTSTLTRSALLALLAAPFVASCELDMCNEDAVSSGGICFPLDPIAASVVPVCGNGLCERRGYEKETEASCPADCDGGYLARASLLWILTSDLWNAQIAGKSWPGGQVSTSGACPGGGTTTLSGVAAAMGDANVYELSYGMSACSAKPLSFLGALTVEGTIARSGAFDNTAHTDNAHFSGSATLSGRDGDADYGPVTCALDFDRIQTGTVARTMGQLCGKDLRTVLYDDAR